MRRFIIGMVALATVASMASAGVVIFDDAYQNGFTKGNTWQATTTTTMVYAGTTAVDSQQWVVNANYTFGGVTDKLLDFYVNMQNATATLMRVDITATQGGVSKVFSFAQYPVPTGAIYVIDGTPVGATKPGSNAGVPLDTDPASWQHIVLDLTQAPYRYYPAPINTYVADPPLAAGDVITKISIYGGASANHLYGDNLQLVPEPATMSLLGLGLLGMLRRRRA